MNVTLIVQIVLGTLPFITAFIAFHLSTRSIRAQSDAAAKAVDAEAYDRATKINDAAIGRLRSELDDTRADLAVARTELAKVRDCPSELVSAREEIAGLRAEVEWLREQMRRLRLGNGPGPGFGAPAG